MQDAAPIHSSITSLRLLAGMTMGTSALVLLGVFTMPVRLGIVIAVAVGVAWRARLRLPSAWSRHRAMTIAIGAAAIAATIILAITGTTEPIR